MTDREGQHVQIWALLSAVRANPIFIGGWSWVVNLAALSHLTHRLKVCHGCANVLQ